MAKVFFSYSHVDEGMRDQLDKHLSMLKRNGVIETWHDRRIVPGERFDEAIDANLNAADIILLLISKDFLASDYCYSVEMNRALERNASAQAKVIPVILRACDWKDGPFGKLQALPKDAKPVASWADVDAGYLDVVEGLKRALPSTAISPRSGAVAAMSPVADNAARPIRSSNLRVRQEFSDADKHRFQQETFEYMSRFFDNSADELHKRNEGIEGSVIPLSARQFSALLFRHGKQVSQCCVTSTQNSMFGGASITYSNNAENDGHSFNESVSVAADEQTMYLRPMGMWRLGQERDRKLSQEGAAELFWEIFVEPLQR